MNLAKRNRPGGAAGQSACVVTALRAPHVWFRPAWSQWPGL